MTPRSPQIAVWLLLACVGMAVPAASTGAEPRELLQNARKVLFLGDSITYAGQYVADVEAWMLTQDWDRIPRVVNAGLPSETVSGLSEDGHAGGMFPRPDLAERLNRVLAAVKPDLVFACYGMNCGIYLPFSEERFQKYQAGIRHLKERVEAEGAVLVLVTPPIYDDQRGKLPMPYNAVLDRYSEWLLAQREIGWNVIDLHGPMAAELMTRRETMPDFTFQPDAVHPNADGQWLIARQLIRALGDDKASQAVSPEAMLSSKGLPPELMKLVQQRMAVLRDAYLSSAGHKRPGIKPGLPLPEAEMQAKELTEKIDRLVKTAAK